MCVKIPSYIAIAIVLIKFLENYSLFIFFKESVQKKLKKNFKIDKTVHV